MYAMLASTSSKPAASAMERDPVRLACSRPNCASSVSSAVVKLAAVPGAELAGAVQQFRPHGNHLLAHQAALRRPGFRRQRGPVQLAMALDSSQDGFEKRGFVGLAIAGIAIQAGADIGGEAVQLLADSRVGPGGRIPHVPLDAPVIDLDGDAEARQGLRAILDGAPGRLLLLVHGAQGAGGGGAGYQDEGKESQKRAQKNPAHAAGGPLGLRRGPKGSILQVTWASGHRPSGLPLLSAPGIPRAKLRVAPPWQRFADIRGG